MNAMPIPSSLLRDLPPPLRPLCSNSASDDLRQERGFTLIELLVVLAIIVAFAGVLGLGARDSGRSGIVLQSAQAQVASLLQGARAHAARHQVSTRLLVYATPPPAGDAQKYLRCLQIAAESAVGRDEWIAVGEPLLLPPTALVVPPVMPGTHLAAGTLWPDGPSAPLSQLTEYAQCVLSGTDFGRVYSIAFTPDGRLATSVGELVFAVAQPSAYSFPRFSNPAAVRRITVRASGALQLSGDSHGD